MPGDETGFRYRFSYAALNDYRSETAVFSDVFAFDTRIAGMTASGKTTQFVYHAVTGNFFTGLQVAPLLGRCSNPAKGNTVAGDRARAGHQFWQRRFGGDPGVIGMTVRVDGEPARIIGIAPPGFHGLYQGRKSKATCRSELSRTRRADWPPLHRPHDPVPDGVRASAPGRDEPAAQTAVEVIAQRLQRQHSQEKTSRPASARADGAADSDAVPVGDRADDPGIDSRPRRAGAVDCVHERREPLLLVRATVRSSARWPCAPRSAPAGDGSSGCCSSRACCWRWRARPPACAARALGDRAVRRQPSMSRQHPAELDFHYDWRVFLYASAIAGVTGALMGIVPRCARRARRSADCCTTAGTADRPVEAGSVCGADGGGAGRGLARAADCRGLCVRSSQRAQLMDLGFDPTNVLTSGSIRTRWATTVRERRLLRGSRAPRPRVARGRVAGMAFSVPMGYIFDGCVAAPEGQVSPTDEPQSNMGANPRHAGILRPDADPHPERTRASRAKTTSRPATWSSSTTPWRDGCGPDRIPSAGGW